MPFDLIWRRSSRLVLPDNSTTATIALPTDFFPEKEWVIPALPVGAMTKRLMAIRRTKVMP